MGDDWGNKFMDDLEDRKNADSRKSELSGLLAALAAEWRKRAAQYWNEPITDKNYEKNQTLSKELNKCAYELEVEFKKCC